ncbi:MAG: acyl-CoA thioester hydrolase/BAAT C-terminal domain-containing protein [Jatrophihabitantaceae bacterium]
MALALTGCSASHHSKVALAVTPATALYDAPLTTTLHGLPAGALVSVSASAPAKNGTVWSASADYRADPSGTVTLAQTALGGSYAGQHPMGLFSSLEPPPTSADGSFVPPDQGFDLSIRASVAGKQVATATVHRLSAAAVGVTHRPLRVATDGIYGELFRPVDTMTVKPAVLMFGGSEGGLNNGLQRDAAVLAAHGYPTLALAYFAEPGLPAKLADIPLEYFARAVGVLRAQPGIDPKHVLVFGVSRGGEAALLVGSLFPNVVNGVIAGVPSSVVGPAPGKLSVANPAWTLGGRPLAHIGVGELGNPNPAGDQAAVIKVDKIAGPVLLSCGGDDNLWPSCPYVDAITARLKRLHFSYPVTALQYPAGGHFAGDFSSLSIMTATALGVDGGTGGTPFANALANLDGHAKLLSFLAQQ